MKNKGSNKIRLLYELKYLQHASNPDHPLNASQIIQMLSDQGIEAERKTIYDDISALQKAGYDINSVRAADQSGYYLNSDIFDKAELRLLADAVMAANFVTSSKTELIIGKLLSMTNDYDAKAMRPTLNYTHNKADNEQIIYNVDAIQNALEQHKAITFRYFDSSIEGKKNYRDKNYDLIPYDMIWNQDRYYLIGYNEKYKNFNHYRLDKMENIQLHDTNHQRVNLDINKYMEQMIQMFSGEAERVELICKTKFAGEVQDQFGREMSLISSNSEEFKISVKAMITDTFFSWIVKFGGNIRIAKPASVQRRMIAFLKEVIASVPIDDTINQTSKENPQ